MNRVDPHEPPPDDLGSLFHRLNNQLGIILANAEILEIKGGDESMRARAGLVVSSAIEAMATARELRARVEPGAPPGSGASMR